jgi:hypothetical protein
MDDSINIGRMEDAVIAVRSETEFRVVSRAIAWFVESMEPGDELLAYDWGTGAILGRGRVVEVTERLGHARTVKLDVPIRGVRPRAEPKARDYTTFYNLSACGAGYVIRGNVFLSQMRSAMLLRAGGTIEDNYIDDVGGMAVYHHNEPQHGEGPIPHGTVIRRNRVVNCRHNPGFVVAAASFNPKMAPLPLDIVIEKNDVTVLGDYPALRLVNASAVTVRDNTFAAPEADKAIEIRNCGALEFRGNLVNGKPATAPEED